MPNFGQLTQQELQNLINEKRDPMICFPMYGTIFLFVYPISNEGSTFLLKKYYKSSNDDIGLYSQILQSQLKKEEDIDTARNKIKKNDLVGEKYVNDEASLKLHINLNDIHNIDQKVIEGLINLLVDEANIENNNLKYQFKIVRPENTATGRFKDTDQFTVYLDKYSSTEAVFRLSEKIETYLNQNGLKNNCVLGPKDSFGFNQFVSARFDTNKILQQYNVYKFFDVELGKFFESTSPESLKNVPLCAFEAVFYHCLLNSNIKLNNQESLALKDSKLVQEQLKIMTQDTKKYLQNYKRTDLVSQVDKQALFKKYIDELELQVKNLKGRRDKAPTGSDDYRKLDAAYNKADSVHSTIKDAAEKYFAQKMSYADFKQCSDDVIKDAKPVLEEHRGGKAVLEVLINIALFLVSLIRSAWNGKMTLFKLETESVKKVNAVEDSVNKAAP